MEQVEQEEQRNREIFKEFGVGDNVDEFEDMSDYYDSSDEILNESRPDIDSYKDESCYEELLYQEKLDFNNNDIAKSEEKVSGYKDVSDYEMNCDELSAETKEIRQDIVHYKDVSDYKAGPKGGLSALREDKAFAILKDKDIYPYDLARKVLEKHKIRHLDFLSTGRLGKYNGKIWEPIINLEELELLVYEQMGEEDRKRQKSIRSFCRKVVEFIQYECMERYKSGERFSEEDFKKIENRIVFRNCVYDAKTGEIFPHDAELPYYIGINADYLEEDESTPIYDKLKRDATGNDKESEKMLDYMLSYLMLPNRSAKCYFVMAPARDSGKSVFGHFIESIYMGDRVKTINLEHLAGRFSLSNADSMVLLSGLETGTDRISEAVVAQIKRITGEDKIRIETKYKNEVNASIRFKLLLATNGGMLLESGIQDKAFYRRTIVIPFINSTPLNEIIADMPLYLQKEKSAILSKAARKIGKIIGDDGGIVFPESEMSRRIKALWSGERLYAKVFIKQNLEFTGNPEDALPKEDIYIRYQEYIKSMPGDIIICTKDELMKKIINYYSGVTAKKLRRASIENADDIKPRQCLTGLKWKTNSS